MLKNPTIAPMAPAMRPPTTAAASTGHPWLLASSAQVMAPTPANVIWQSQSMPPSPVTMRPGEEDDGEGHGRGEQPDPIAADEQGHDRDGADEQQRAAVPPDEAE